MKDKIEFILHKLTGANLKLLERDVGIPATRMYKWRDGKGKPKASDAELLWNYFQNEKKLSQKSNINQYETKNKDVIGKYRFGDAKEVNHELTYPINSTLQKANMTPKANSEHKGVPYYDIDFMGGFDLVFNDQTIQPLFYIDFLPFNDCDCWINVTGKSMGPLIAHGDIVGLKKVDNWKRFLLEGEIYAVITDNGFRTIKMIGAGPDKEHYTLIPYNKSEEYKPQIIPKDVITHIFRVKGNIKKFF